MPRVPSQLTIRLTLLLCVLLGANTFGFIELYRYHLRYELAPGMGEAIADWVQIARACDSSLTGDERLRWLQKANQDRERRLELLPADTVVSPEPQKLFISLLESAIRRRAGNDVQAEADFGNKVLKVYFTSGEHRFVMSVPGTALRASDVWPFVWLIASNFLIVWLCVVFAVWQINQPLKHSAEALAKSSGRLQEISLPASAPQEFHVFAEHFNELARRLAAQEKERALLLAGVSHDLRAPLTRIQLRAELLEQSEARAASSLAMDAGSMRHIIDQFLDYQRGNIEANARLIELRMAAADMVERYRESGRDVRFQGKCSALVLADPSAIERILGNLIDNALDYGAAPVEVSLLAEGGNAMLEIRDHGPGIAVGEVERLLQPFERLDDARSLHGHCGLGLSIVNRLVKELRGTLAIANHPEGGLSARVTLPIGGSVEA